MNVTRDDTLREQYRQLVTVCSTNVDTSNADELRKLVLLEGLPSDANALETKTFGRCSLRGLVWKALLGIGYIDIDEYTKLVKRGPSTDDSRVREDARRTFAKSDDFTTRVPTCKIIRLLNAYVIYHGNKRGIYAQSMSLLAAPFLYIMPEPDAFHCFRKFVDYKIISYIEKYKGARIACDLLDKCIMKCLPNLHNILIQHNLYSQVYAFPVMSSLGMCVRPIFDTVRLWDILLAFGIHMHIIFTLARLVIKSKDIVNHAKITGAAPISTRQLEQGFDLNADIVLAKGVSIISQLDQDLYSQLVSHSITSAIPSTPTPTTTTTTTTTTTSNLSSDLTSTSITSLTQQISNHSFLSKPTNSNNNSNNNNNNNTVTNSTTTSNMTNWPPSVDKHIPPPGHKHNNDIDRVEVENISVDDIPASSRDNNDVHDDEQFTPSKDRLMTRAARRGIRTSYDRIHQQNLGL